ncbi:MAG: hypothetical protein ABSA68_18245 [Xanthobacteraceae bacterium]|jgi:hypothetical protein
MSSIENHVCTVVAKVLDLPRVQPDTELDIGFISFRQLRDIAYYISHDFNLPDFARCHWECWRSVADVILAVEKAQPPARKSAAA